MTKESADAMNADKLINGRKHALANLGRVLVLGLGVSGKAAVSYLLELLGSRVESLTVLGGKSAEASTAWAEEAISPYMDKGASIEFDTEDVEGEYDVCIVSPGISQFSDFYQSAARASSAVISEVEFAWCESAADSVWIAITGTNGKTTTTALTEHILQTAGLDAKAVGNIGDACITEVGRDLAQGSPARKYYAVETSSYQLASVNLFAPDAAIILGITPDHLKWHRTYEAYQDAKFKLLDNLAGSGGVAVMDATNDIVRAKVREVKAAPNGIAYVPIGTADGINGDMRARCGSANAAFVSGDGTLTVAFDGAEHALAGAAELQIAGSHNQLNALAAASAALACGVSAADASQALRTFEPLEHRIEPSGTVGGIKYYNDSKATNVDATLQALKAFLPVKPIVMLGGDDKGTDLSELVDSCRANAKALVCYGEARDRFFEALRPLAKDGVTVMSRDTFDEAFDAASGFAEEGDIVLLSPACASFDEFSCFEERGDVFKAKVRALAESQSEAR